ncbi:hypothetical protein CCACVL1_22426 [Corchorus capsularis]|uniref:Uncharacterized protein n=1 Tax=Corchorus capsularis TaxID=210143 RepID=A0A1R3GYN4_COCAP|nr:hypothetical protein CCACVL1_22426 [Corchorus capsularis]
MDSKWTLMEEAKVIGLIREDKSKGRGPK